jgi:two-component system OmpR family response regulator
MRALVAEDDPGVRRLVAALLELDGWDVRTAVDGQEAVDMARDWHPDAIVIDMTMPNKDGLAAMREIRAEPGGEDCAVVVVSARTGASDVARAIDAGCDDYVAKPFDPMDLSARARAALRWRGVEGAHGVDAAPAAGS